MFRINKQQLEVFEKAEILSFAARMAAHLRVAFPSHLQELTDLGLSAMILEGINDAAKYGITDENDVRRYLEYIVNHARDFATNRTISWAGEVLRNRYLPGRSKLDRIDAYDQFVLGTGDRIDP